MFFQLFGSIAGTLAAYALYKIAGIAYQELSFPLRHLTGPKANHKQLMRDMAVSMRHRAQSLKFITRAMQNGAILQEQWIRQYGKTFKYPFFFGVNSSVVYLFHELLSFWAGTQAYQLLQVLAFMHDQGIAHGDLYYVGIIHAPHSRTSKRADYRVAFIDFGEARDFGMSGSIQIPCPRPVSGPPADFRAPEIDHCKTFDPFAADVFSMARLVLALYPPACAYRALLNDMGHPDPSVRPSARVALERLESLNRFQTAHQWCAS
ncbi:hypothetical protein R3P38DRAFT_3212699 [Favolaschia claudopus]|uniref:Protein kinase domain-containing protein n=1 Tax=Favolaschia claudopus TaxID=2862362 RepID=A0AAW0ADS8_9AGAR